MPKLKSELHHWWPRGLSSHWAAEDGTTGWIRPDGTYRRVPPHQLGAIRNAHHIKLGEPGTFTHWDSSFEDEFDKADSNFPAVVSRLERLERNCHEDKSRVGFVPQAASDDELRLLTECVVSLAVRSPMNREASVALAERFRGPLKGREREVLIGANMRNSQRLIADSIGSDAKFAVLFSQRQEFHFGDGFFHNVTGVVNRPTAPTILAPITPNIGVIITRPIAYMVEPRLSIVVLNEAQVNDCNHAVQVYARNAIYFRNDIPIIADAFAQGVHLQYSHPDNPISQLVRSIPGVPQRDTTMDFLWETPPQD